MNILLVAIPFAVLLIIHFTSQTEVVKAEPKKENAKKNVEVDSYSYTYEDSPERRKML